MASAQSTNRFRPFGPLGRLVQAIGLARPTAAVDDNHAPPTGIPPPSADFQDARLTQLERRLHAAEARLARTQAMARLGTWEWSVGDGTSWWSDELRRLLDLPAGCRPAYDTFLACVHADDRGRVAGLISRALADGQGFSTTYRVRRAGGGERVIRHEAHSVLGEGGLVVRVDAVLQDSGFADAGGGEGEADGSALATLGEVAGGMAHELSQPLNILRMTAEDAALRHRRGRLDGEGTAQVLTRIAEQADRMARVVDHIRIFSRRDASPRCTFDAVAAVRGGVAAMAPQFTTAGIAFSHELPAGELAAHGRPDQFEQVVVSLLTNACQAVEDARAHGLPASRVDLTCEAGGGILRLMVADDGIGLPPGARGRLFEPFFTTKDVGRGSGLGLSVAYGIVTAMGGTLAAADTARGGASFTITIPVSDQPQCAGDACAGDACAGSGPSRFRPVAEPAIRPEPLPEPLRRRA